MNSARRTSSRHARRAGFTLVEVLVVLLIVGLIGAVASLRASMSPVAESDDEGNRLRQMLESGFDRSRLARAPVVWQAGADHYVLTVREGGAERQIARRELRSPVRILKVWQEGALQTPPYELMLSGRDPGLFRILLGTEQSALELRSTLLGRIEMTRSD